MKKILNLIRILSIVVIILNIIIPNIVLAVPNLEGIYNDPGSTDVDPFLGDLLGVVQVASGFALVISLLVLAVQFFLGAPEGKSDAKKRILGILIGSFLVFSASTIISAIAGVANKLGK